MKYSLSRIGKLRWISFNKKTPFYLKGITKVRKRVLIMTSVSVEKEAVLRGLGENHSGFDVVIAGVGPAAAAASTATALATGKYDLVICLGIAGGFVPHAEIGSLVVATEIIAADLGVETSEGFLSVDKLGFGHTCITLDRKYVNEVTEALNVAGLTVIAGPVLSVSTVTGTQERAEQLALQVAGASAEAMEGYGVAIAAQQQGIPVLEIRAISNRVGPRNRSEWRIEEALESLTKASSILKEIL